MLISSRIVVTSLNIIFAKAPTDCLVEMMYVGEEEFQTGHQAKLYF